MICFVKENKHRITKTVGDWRRLVREIEHESKNDGSIYGAIYRGGSRSGRRHVYVSLKSICTG